MFALERVARSARGLKLSNVAKDLEDDWKLPRNSARSLVLRMRRRGWFSTVTV